MSLSVSWGLGSDLSRHAERFAQASGAPFSTLGQEEGDKPWREKAKVTYAVPRAGRSPNLSIAGFCTCGWRWGPDTSRLSYSPSSVWPSRLRPGQLPVTRAIKSPSDPMLTVLICFVAEPAVPGTCRSGVDAPAFRLSEPWALPTSCLLAG